MAQSASWLAQASVMLDSLRNKPETNSKLLRFAYPFYILARDIDEAYAIRQEVVAASTAITCKVDVRRKEIGQSTIDYIVAVTDGAYPTWADGCLLCDSFLKRADAERFRDLHYSSTSASPGYLIETTAPNITYHVVTHPDVVVVDLKKLTAEIEDQYKREKKEQAPRCAYCGQYYHAHDRNCTHCGAPTRPR